MVNATHIEIVFWHIRKENSLLLHSRFWCRHETLGGALRDYTTNGCVADYKKKRGFEKGVLSD